MDVSIEEGLIPIVCVGETLDQKEAGETKLVITGQLKVILNGLSSDYAGKFVIAYEPIWAIGTGKTATPDQAQSVHELIRNLIREYCGNMAENFRILYGGSVNRANAEQLLSKPDVDGLLIGGASLNVDEFSAICKVAETV
jgi:triosephosphate isomerase